MVPKIDVRAANTKDTTMRARVVRDEPTTGQSLLSDARMGVWLQSVEVGDSDVYFLKLLGHSRKPLKGKPKAQAVCLRVNTGDLDEWETRVSLYPSNSEDAVIECPDGFELCLANDPPDICDDEDYGEEDD